MGSTEDQLLRRIRILLVGFMVGLIISGATAFPLPAELRTVCGWVESHGDTFGWLVPWLGRVRDALNFTEGNYPFLFYGYDWLAFGHLVIALIFIGPFNDPVRNVWVLRWGVMACALVIPLALICGAIRGIPLGWQVIDCSFGVVGIVPLLVCLRAVKRIESLRPS